ncbi:hypothetical protein L209DRAFT_746834 [Thermothelomyces heterothallicus CBS 203.75]
MSFTEPEIPPPSPPAPNKTKKRRAKRKHSQADNLKRQKEERLNELLPKYQEGTFTRRELDELEDLWQELRPGSEYRGCLKCIKRLALDYNTRPCMNDGSKAGCLAYQRHTCHPVPTLAIPDAITFIEATDKVLNLTEDEDISYNIAVRLAQRNNELLEELLIRQRKQA